MRSIGLVALVLLSYGIGSAAVLCATKKGAVKLRGDACKPKETAIDPVALGLQGPKGDPGTGLITIGETVGPVSLSGAYTSVAATNGADAPSANGGAWYGPITVPATSTVVIVTAHVVSDAASGTLDCTLERSVDGAPYTTRATTTATGAELFLNDVFPAFTVGDALQFRVSCRVSGGARSVTRADIGAIASVLPPG